MGTDKKAKWYPQMTQISQMDRSYPQKTQKKFHSLGFCLSAKSASSVDIYVLLALLALVLGVPRDAGAAVLEVGPGKLYQMPSAAIAAAHDGDTVRIAPGAYFDCAVVHANDLTIEGTDRDAGAVLTDKACAGKGLLVIDANDVTVRHLTLTRVRVPDGNGAGIRAEGRGLTVEGVRFIDNQEGILANPQPEGTILVRDSEFLRNGACDGACAHGIYVGALKLLRVEHSSFAETRHAHHIKSRASRTEVIGCEITDGPDGTASYEIELPNGGALLARDNRITKGPKAENHSGAIVIGMEGVTQPTPEITVAHNVFRNAGNYRTHFVVNMTATEALLTGNTLTGAVDPLRGDGTVK
jgi:hypothetical protein